MVLLSWAKPGTPELRSYLMLCPAFGTSVSLFGLQGVRSLPSPNYELSSLRGEAELGKGRHGGKGPPR